MALNRFFIIFVFVLFPAISSHSQDFSQFRVGEDSIRSLLLRIKNSDTDSVRINLNSEIITIFSNLLKKPESFYFKFDSLKWFGRLESPDKLFRILTWNIILRDGTHRYSGFIQVRQPKSGDILLFELTDKADEIEKRENSVLSAGKWYGGLYYKILKNKVNQISYYTILSLRYNNLFTTSKVIEILYFDEFGNPVFGAPLFTDGKNIKLRVVFEYSANVAMNMNYDEARKMIIFDHLSPSDPRFIGQYDYYGPDFSFDGLQFKNNIWKLITDLDIKRPDDKMKESPKRIPLSNKIGR